jgi:hypothetical protein
MTTLSCCRGLLGAFVLGAVFAAACSIDCKEPDEPIFGKSCVLGTPGTRCGDIATPATCRDGKWQCPSGMILAVQCGRGDGG